MSIKKFNGVNKIIFLGTAAAVASGKRDNTSLFFRAGKEKVLIDCPGSVVQKLCKCGIDFRKISAVFLTHAHPDHVYGLPSLIHSLSGRKEPVKVFAKEQTVRLVKKLISLFNLNGEGFPPIEYKSVNFGDKISFQGFGVEIFKVRHTPSSIGLKISWGKVSVVYSGDTGPCGELIKAAENCDYLIHDCFAPVRFKKKVSEIDVGHTSALTLGGIARRTSAKCLIPIHFSQEHRFSMQDIKREIRKNYKGKIIIAEDGGFLELMPLRA